MLHGLSLAYNEHPLPVTRWAWMDMAAVGRCPPGIGVLPNRLPHTDPEKY